MIFENNKKEKIMKELYYQIVEIIIYRFSLLVKWKEKILKIFFAWPWVKPIFRYISPNDLCYLRILAAILILFLFMRGDFGWLFPIFIIAVLMDFIDGPLARATDQETLEGKKLDPIADKVLISIPLLVIGIKVFDTQTISMYILIEGLLILLANFLKPYLQGKGIPLADGANVFGQVKMFCQTFAVGFLLYDPTSTTIVAISEIIIWIAIGFGIGSFLRHLSRMKIRSKDNNSEDNDIFVLNPKKRIITIPNLITLSAIFLIVPAAIALMREQYLMATLMIIWILGSDGLDGWLARKYHQETYFGAALDPIRDHLARLGLIFWIFAKLDNQLLSLMIVTLVVLEFAIGISCTYMANKYHTVNLVNRWGKNRALAHFILLAVPYFHIIGVYHLSNSWLILSFAVMIIFSIIAFVSYLSQRIKTVVEEIKKAP